MLNIQSPGTGIRCLVSFGLKKHLVIGKCPLGEAPPSGLLFDPGEEIPVFQARNFDGKGRDYVRFLQQVADNKSIGPLVRVDGLPDELLRKTMGGKGLATHLLLEHNPPRVDPLSPANH
jgi:hypothetical protein